LDLAVYSLIGYSAGFAISLLFKNKSIIRNSVAGLGGSYGFVLNKASIKDLVWKWW
jgi:hypothetical protein